MMPRSQLAALAVMLVGLGVVLVLVGDTGVSTGVFVAGQLTETPSPTVGPSPTPLPDGQAVHWVMSQPGQYSYIDPNISAQIMHQTSPQDELIASTGLAQPAAEDRYPLISLLDQLRSQLEIQIDNAGLTLEPGALTGPVIEIVDGQPVHVLRAIVAPQTAATGQEFAGLDIAQILLDRPDEQVTYLQYVQQGELDPVVYADFRAWLEAHITELTGTETETAPEAMSEAAATPEVTPEAESMVEATVEPTLAATAIGTPEVDQAPIGQAPPTAATVDAIPTEKWTEFTPGQVMYAVDGSAFIQYMATTRAAFARNANVEFEGDQAPSVGDILDSVRARLEEQFAQDVIAVDADAFEGPVTEEINGIPFSYLHLSIAAQTAASGEQVNSQEILMGIIETGPDTLTAVQFAYQGETNPSVYADFREWLEDNIVRLSELEVPESDATPAVEPTAVGD